jgi:ribosome recycling factor
MLEGMRVRTHGQELPMEAVGNVSVLDSATLCVELFDPSAANDVVSAIERSNLALNARFAGSKGESNRVIVPVPSLTEEKRKSMQKATKDAAEKARANVRRHRSEAMNRIKGSALPEDDARREQKQVQNVTDEHAREIEKAVDAKTSELQSA